MALCFKSLCVKIMRELRGKEIWLVFLFKPTFIPFFCDFWHVPRIWAWAAQLCFGSLCYFPLLLSSVLPLVCSSSGLDLPLASQLESSTLCRAHLMITVANFPDDFVSQACFSCLHFTLNNDWNHTLSEFLCYKADFRAVRISNVYCMYVQRWKENRYICNIWLYYIETWFPSINL